MAFYGNLSGATGRSSGSEDAKGIKYTDTMSIGGTNVQAVLDIIADKVLHGLLTKAEATQIVDALNSTSTTAALSANQGHELYVKTVDNWGQIEGIKDRLTPAEESIDLLLNRVTVNEVDITNGKQNITDLQSDVAGIKSSIPSGIIVTSDGGAGAGDVSNGSFQIMSGGIQLRLGNSQSVLIGLVFRPVGTVSLTTTPVTIARISNLISSNGLFMNSESFGITGASVVAMIDGEENGSALDLKIRSASGTISVPNYEQIVVPPLFIFHL